MDMVSARVLAPVALLLCSLPNIALSAVRPVYCGTQQWEPFIAEAAERFTVDPIWIRAVMLAESGGCESIDGEPITSVAGAMGLMQLMPATWKDYRDRLALGNDPYDPKDNILAGTAFLKDLQDRFGWPAAAAAYHAGPARYADYLNGTRSLPEATTNYLARVERFAARLSGGSSPAELATQQANDGPSRSIFVIRSRTVRAREGAQQERQNERLFIRLRSGKQTDDKQGRDAQSVQKE